MHARFQPVADAMMGSQELQNDSRSIRWRERWWYAPCADAGAGRGADMRGDVQDIFKMTPHDKQVMMFSATLSKEIRPICKKFMSDVSAKGLPPRSRGAALRQPAAASPRPSAPAGASPLLACRLAASAAASASSIFASPPSPLVIQPSWAESLRGGPRPPCRASWYAAACA